MVVAGLEAAVDLAELALEETGFGVLEDKVVKNYIATEFLYDYLQDKRSVGVIDEDAERAIQYVAEPIGVVLALLPITNPTSTALFKSIVAAKTRNAVIFRPSARAARCATRAIEILQRAGEAEGLPPDALQVIPDATLEVSQYLFHHPGVDLIWTTGGPKAVAAANAAGKPCICVGAGQRARLPARERRRADGGGRPADLQDVRRVGDLPGRADVRRRRRHPRRRRRRARAPGRARARLRRRSSASPPRSSTPTAASPWPRSGAPAPTSPRWPASRRATRRCSSRRSPPTSRRSPLHPLLQEKLMPVLGLVRSPSVEHALDVCELVTEHGGLGHTSAVYARDEAVVQAFAARIRTGRILVNAPTAVGALGGIYNAMPPTFSLGCGTWGGSTTTDNVNYRNLLNIKAVSRRQAPPQWFRVPSDTYFNAGALDSLRTLDARTAVIVTDAATQARGAVDEVRRHLGCDALHVFADVEPEPGEAGIRAGAELLDRLRPDLIVAVGGGSVIDAAKAMRLFHEHPEVTLRELTLPFLDARKRVARYPQGEHRVRLVAVPTTVRHRLRGLPRRRPHRGRAQGHARRLLAGPRRGGRRSDADADACRPS